MSRAITYGAWTGGGFLIAAALLLFAPQLAEAQPLRWLGVYGLALAGMIALLARRGPARLGMVDLAAGAFLAWAALSLSWSGDWRAGLMGLQNMTALFAVAFLFRHAVRLDGLVISALGISAALAVGAAAFWPQYHGGFGNPNFQAETMVLMVPLLLLMPQPWTRGVLDWLLLPAILALILWLFFWNPSNVQHLAVAGWAAILGIALMRLRAWRWLALLAAVSIGALAVAWYAGMLDAVAVSLIRRGEIWLNTLSIIRDHPLFGAGLGSFDYTLPRADHLWLIRGSFLENPTDFMGAAHNEYLQLWAELGLVGIALAVLLARAVIPGAWADPARRAGLACLATAAMLALVGFPLQNPATGLLVAIGAGLAARGGRVIRVPALKLAGLAAIPLAVGLFLQTAASTQAALVHRYIVANPLIALKANINALEIYPLDPWIRLQGMLSLRAVLQRYRGHVDLSVSAADRMFERSQSAIPDQPGVLLARAEYLLNSGRYVERDLIEDLFARLRRVAPHYPQASALETVYAVLIGDEGRATRLAAATLAKPGGAGAFAQMGFVKKEKPQ